VKQCIFYKNDESNNINIDDDDKENKKNISSTFDYQYDDSGDLNPMEYVIMQIDNTRINNIELQTRKKEKQKHSMEKVKKYEILEQKVVWESNEPKNLLLFLKNDYLDTLNNNIDM